MDTIAAGVSFIDLQFQGRARVIASAILHGAGGVAIVDPGPSSTLPLLTRRLSEAGIALADVTAVLLTHIHLDHAGATGSLVRKNPLLKVYVHGAGAPHMADPGKLISSAARLYGDAMDTLWGDVAPVPLGAMVVLTGGERIRVAGRDLDVAYTPGHASHHVSYFSRDTGVAFVGDTAGVMVVPGGFVLPPTPPPDIDLERWDASLSVIEDWRPETLFLTHFGPTGPTGVHLSQLRENLDLVGRISRQAVNLDVEESKKEAWFVAQLRQELTHRTGEADAAAYETSAQFDLNWRGLARYWRKRQATA